MQCCLICSRNLGNSVTTFCPCVTELSMIRVPLRVEQTAFLGPLKSYPSLSLSQALCNACLAKACSAFSFSTRSRGSATSPASLPLSSVHRRLFLLHGSSLLKKPASTAGTRLPTRAAMRGSRRKFPLSARPFLRPTDTPKSPAANSRSVRELATAPARKHRPSRGCRSSSFRRLPRLRQPKNLGSPAQP